MVIAAGGLTASDGPFDYSPDEPVNGRNDGTIAPTGAVSSFPYTPVESMKAPEKLLLQLWKIFVGRIWFSGCLQSFTKLVFGNLYGIEPGAHGSNDRKLPHRPFMEIIYEQC